MRLNLAHYQMVFLILIEMLNSPAPEYFFNYFQYGVALLFSPLRDHTMQKVLLHSNLPQSHAFQRFHRCRWIFRPTGGKKDPLSTVLHSEMNFDEIKTALEKLSGPTPKPMIVNRGNQASPSSSIELVSDDILTATPYGCTGTSPSPSYNVGLLTTIRIIWVCCRGTGIRGFGRGLGRPGDLFQGVIWEHETLLGSNQVALHFFLC